MATLKRFTITADNADTVIPAIGKYLRALNLEKPQHLTIDDKKETRRTQQNRLYWKWVSIAGEELGYERAEMHDTLVLELLGMMTKEIGGKTIETMTTTHDMNVSDFSDYMEKVSRWAGKMQIRLPAEE